MQAELRGAGGTPGLVLVSKMFIADAQRHAHFSLCAPLLLPLALFLSPLTCLSLL